MLKQNHGVHTQKLTQLYKLKIFGFHVSFWGCSLKNAKYAFGIRAFEKNMLGENKKGQTLPDGYDARISIPSQDFKFNRSAGKVFTGR